MAMSRKVRYVGAVSPVDLPTLRIANVKRGDVIEVAPEDAGRPPSGEEGDLGTGLLAQVANFEPVADEPKAKETTK